MSDIEDISRKIGGLLAKAEATDNEHEAEAFFTKAFALMAEHQIDEMRARQAAGADVKPEQIIKHVWHFTGTMSSAHASLATDIGFVLGFRVLIKKDKTHRYLTWYGFESDVRDGITLVNSLMIQAARFRLKAENDENLERPMDRHAKFKFRRSFTEAFGSRVAARIRENRRQAFEEAEGGSLLPALIDRDKAVDRYVNELYGNRLRAARQGHQKGDWRGSSAGRQAGDRADIGNKAVGGKKELGR